MVISKEKLAKELEKLSEKFINKKKKESFGFFRKR